MDINLTGQIAATLPYNDPLSNIGAGVFGGLVAGLLTLSGVWMAQKHEVRRIRRDERRQAYTNYLSNIFYMNYLFRTKKSPENEDISNFFKFAGEVKLLGSPEIIRCILITDPQDFADSEKMKEYGNNLVRLMAEELQDSDVYEKVNGLISRDTIT